MKSFLVLLIRQRSKNYCFVLILVLFSALSTSGQTIYSDQDLLTKGNTYYQANKYALAQLYLFAYVQRNTLLYQSKTDFKSQIDAALSYAASNSRLPGAGGNFAPPPPRYDANHRIIPRVEPPKPPLNSAIPASGNATLDVGMYSSNDGGSYYVAVINKEVWWYGQAKDGSWSNVMHGVISGDEIQGKWSYVPLGRISGSGTISLKITSTSAFTIITQTGNFNGTTWNKISSGRRTQVHG